MYCLIGDLFMDYMAAAELMFCWLFSIGFDWCFVVMVSVAYVCFLGFDDDALGDGLL